MVTTKGALGALITTLLVAATFFVPVREARSQQVNVGTPFSNVSDTFFERSAVGFSARGNGWFFNNIGSGAAIPPFGGFDPNVGGSLGFGFGGGDFSGQLGFNFGSGSTRSFSSQTPSVTFGNGGFGMIQETRWTPFITEIIPIVGDRAPVSPLANAIARMQAQGGIGQIPMRPTQPAANSGSSTPRTVKSSAEHGALSVAEIKRQQAEEEEATSGPIKALLDEAKQYASSQDWKEARKSYYAALDIAPEHRKKEILALIREMERKHRGDKN
jgi:hypothetical protein